MKVTRAQVPEIGNFMDDLWKFMKAYLIPEDNDQYWDDVVKDAGRLMKKYNHDPIIDNIVSGFVAGLDEKWRKNILEVA